MAGWLQRCNMALFVPDNPNFQLLRVHYFQSCHHFYSPYYLHWGYMFNSLESKGLFISCQFWIKTVHLPVLFQDFFKFCCGGIPYEYASIMRATYYILTIWTEECKRWKHMKFLKLTFTFNTVVKYRIIQRKQISLPEWCSSVIRCDLETIST